MDPKKDDKKNEETELQRKEREPDMICGMEATTFIILATVGACIFLIVIVVLAIKLSNPGSTSQADLDERTSSLKTKHMINPLRIKNY